ncbi:MAG: type II secretion system F family protein [Desulfuromonadales bacterium]|nr:type II secretion system F family protein [Desulfuromonadales bacterium]
MKRFSWEAKTRTGAAQKGIMEAPNEKVVENQLRKFGFTGIVIKEIKAARNPLFGKKVKQKDIVVFTRQLSTMIDAGMPLIQCFDILANQQEKKTFKEILTDVKGSIEGGSTISEGLARHPKVFDELYVNLVNAGEAGGILDTIMGRLAAYIEKAQKLKKRVKGAMTYPATVMGIAFIVVAVILIFVIPVFAKMFKDFGAALPAPTQFVINLSNFIVGHHGLNLAIIGAVLFGIYFVLKKYYATAGGRRAIDALFLKIPVVGPLIRKVAVAKFTRTLGTMMSSGVSIMDGMEIVAKTAGNKVIEEAIYKVRQAISEGQTVAKPLEESKVFPPMVVQMIAVGEASGAMDVMLNKIADFYDDEVDDAVNNMTALMEPFLILFLGVVVGGLVIAMYLPIFKIAGVVSGQG